MNKGGVLIYDKVDNNGFTARTIGHEIEQTTKANRKLMKKNN